MIKQKIEAYEKNNIYEFDNNIILHYYPNRIMELIGGGEKSCLELGIGRGYTVELFSQFFDKYVVLDGDSEMIHRFKEKFPEINAKVVETYFEEWETTETFDVIILGFVLEHVQNPNYILNKYRRFLTTNGKMFITVPNGEALHRRIGVEAGLLNDLCQLSDHDINVGHRRYYTLDKLRKEVEDAGLNILCEEGLFLKPITTRQMMELKFTDDILKGYLKVGRDYPELCSSIMLEAGCHE